MPAIELTEQQVVDLVSQLRPEQKRSVLMSLAERAEIGRDQRMVAAEDQLRRLCRDRGLDWDAMSADEREDFFDELVHEDRPCPLQ